MIKINQKVIQPVKTLLFVGLLAVIGLMVQASTALAAPEPVEGYAWSSNIGWICFDCGVSNNVTIENTTGDFNGYAWSSNIGWIDFSSNLSGFPESPSHRARLASDGEVTGWARALSYGGGWDGWIKMSGAWDNGVNLTGNNFSGYAWGSEVVGWVDFSRVTTAPLPDLPPATPAPVVAVVQPDCGTDQIDLSWSAVPGATSYQLYDGADPSPVLIYDEAALSYSHTPLVGGSSHNYRLRARNAFGQSAFSAYTAVSVPAECGVADLVAAKPTFSPSSVEVGDTISFEGEITNVGSVDAPAYTNDVFYIDVDGDGVSDYDVPASGVPGGTLLSAMSTTDGDWTVPEDAPYGNSYRVGYFADKPNSVDEGVGDHDTVNWSGWSTPFTVIRPVAAITAVACEIGLDASSCVGTTVTLTSSGVSPAYNLSQDGVEISALSKVENFNVGVLEKGDYKFAFTHKDGSEKLAEITVKIMCKPGLVWLYERYCGYVPEPAPPISPDKLNISADKKIILPGTDVVVSWDVEVEDQSNYKCSVSGRGIKESDGSPPDDPAEINGFTVVSCLYDPGLCDAAPDEGDEKLSLHVGSQTISSIKNNSLYTITCEDFNLGANRYEASVLVEVVPTVQEI